MQSKRNHGFTLIELVIIIVVLGILAAIAIPKLFSVTKEAEEAAVSTMVSNLESALSIYVSKQYMDGNAIVIHNPFDDLSNIPTNYKGVVDPVTPANTPDGSWCWRPTGNWIMYNPKAGISGGWNNGGESFIIYKVETVMDGGDVVGLRLNTTPTYSYIWN